MWCWETRRVANDVPLAIKNQCKERERRRLKYICGCCSSMALYLSSIFWFSAASDSESAICSIIDEMPAEKFMYYGYAAVRSVVGCMTCLWGWGSADQDSRDRGRFQDAAGRNSVNTSSLFYSEVFHQQISRGQAHAHYYDLDFLFSFSLWPRSLAVRRAAGETRLLCWRKECQLTEFTFPSWCSLQIGDSVSVT